MASRGRLIKIIGGIAFLNLLSRLIGFIRDMVIGYQFGTGATSDAIFAAYSLPYFLYVVLGGSLTTAFISIYSKINDPLEQKSFRSWVLLVSGVASFLLALIFGLFSSQITQLIFHGMPQATSHMTSDLLRLMAPSIFFMVMGMLASGLLNVHGFYKWTTFSTLVMNVFLVGIGLLFVSKMGATAHSLAVVVGACLMFVLILFQMSQYRLFQFNFSGNSRNYLGKVFIVFLPILLGGATLQFYSILQRILASGLSEGDISGLNYAMKLVQLPQGIVMAAVTTVLYPKLAKEAMNPYSVMIQRYYDLGMRLLMVVVVSVSFFILFYWKEVVEVVFQHGTFNRHSTLLTGHLLQILVLSMFFNAANIYVTRFFYAYEKSLSPVIMNVISIFIVNLAVALIAIKFMGVYGIALGTMVGAVVNLVLLLIQGQRSLQLDMFQFLQWRDGGYLLSLGLLLYFSHFLLELVDFPYLKVAFEMVYFIVVMFILVVIWRLPEMKWALTLRQVTPLKPNKTRWR